MNECRKRKVREGKHIGKGGETYFRNVCYIKYGRMERIDFTPEKPGFEA